MPTHFEHRALNTKMSFGSAAFFKHDALLMWALWGSWLPPSLQLSTLEGRIPIFKAHNTSQEATRRIHNQQSPVTVRPWGVPRRCIPITIGLLNLVGDFLTLNIVIKVIIFLYLFKHVGTGQSNDASPKIGSPNRGKSWSSGRITVPANLVFRRKIWGARDNGIPPRSTPDDHTRSAENWKCVWNLLRLYIILYIYTGCM